MVGFELEFATKATVNKMGVFGCPKKLFVVGGGDGGRRQGGVDNGQR